MASVNVTKRALQLYREIISLHQTKLPLPMKSIGDSYVRKEFRIHMYSGTCSKAQFDQFLSAWKSYASTIRSQPEVVGKPLSEEQKRLLNEKQRDQLEELEKATAELATPGDETRRP